MRKLALLLSTIFFLGTGYSQTDNLYTDNGIYLEALAGGTSFTRNITAEPDDISLASFNLLAAHRWYMRTDKRYKPGLQLTFVRAGVDVGRSRSNLLGPNRDVVMLNVIPLNLGYASYLTINDVLGMEFNINMGPGMTFRNEFVQLGIHTNPNIKFRYKNLAVGLDASILNGPNIHSSGNGDWYSKNTFSATFGVNF